MFWLRNKKKMYFLRADRGVLDEMHLFPQVTTVLLYIGPDKQNVSAKVWIFSHPPVYLFVCFGAIHPKATAMVMAGRSVHLTTLFPGQA